ncbi:hypothetical protein J8TS2_00290 [Lederbergia ruris]|uniref:Uncharacterized protein n=1 Tax=Lederbergia ruris TaxID=217495 RepID=A0ABQ4KCJ6_9BACI|nr:hypothetical protein J8TS2_00290 [Lederbergia ruris]
MEKSASIVKENVINHEGKTNHGNENLENMTEKCKLNFCENIKFMLK